MTPEKFFNECTHNHQVKTLLKLHTILFLSHRHMTLALTSMSSLFGRRGAIMMFFNKNPSESTSNVCPVICARRSQWRAIIALLDIISNRGQHSLKSSIFFLRSRNACHSFRAFGNLRHLTVGESKEMVTENVCLHYLLALTICSALILALPLKFTTLIVSNTFLKPLLTCSESPATPGWFSRCLPPPRGCRSNRPRCRWHCCKESRASGGGWTLFWFSGDLDTLWPGDRTAALLQSRWCTWPRVHQTAPDKPGGGRWPLEELCPGPSDPCEGENSDSMW